MWTKKRRLTDKKLILKERRKKDNFTGKRILYYHQHL